MITLEQFKTRQPVGGGINLLYEAVGAEYRIHAINVSRTSLDLINVREALNQVTQIQITIVGTQYIANVTSTTVFPTYHALTIDPFLVPAVDNTARSLTYISPSVSEINFERSDYNILAGNTNLVRTIEGGIFKVDRKDSQLLPQDLDLIYTDSGSLAEIQDSNYSVAGLTNARYEGSKTTKTDYSGIDPVLSLSTFEGSLFATTTANNVICLQSFSDRDIVDLQFVSQDRYVPNTTETPNVISGSTAKNSIDAYIDGTLGSPATISSTQTLITNIIYKKKAPQPKAGDFFLLTGNTQEAVEIIEATNNGSFNVTNFSYTFRVKRTSPTTISGISSTFYDIQLGLLNSDTIYQTVNGDTAPVKNKKIWVRETGEIFTTDIYGRVIRRNTTCTT